MPTGFTAAASGAEIAAEFSSRGPRRPYGEINGVAFPRSTSHTCDRTMFDVNRTWPEGSVQAGDWIELMGPTIDVEEGSIPPPEPCRLPRCLTSLGCDDYEREPIGVENQPALTC